MRTGNSEPKIVSSEEVEVAWEQPEKTTSIVWTAEGFEPGPGRVALAESVIQLTIEDELPFLPPAA